MSVNNYSNYCKVSSQNFYFGRDCEKQAKRNSKRSQQQKLADEMREDILADYTANCFNKIAVDNNKTRHPTKTRHSNYFSTELVTVCYFICKKN